MRTEDFGNAQRLNARVALACNFHQREFALDAAAGIADIDYLCDGDEAEQLLLDLLEHVIGAGGDDSDARLVRVAVDLGDRQRLDVVATGGEQADDAGEHARLVVDDAGERSLLDALVGRGHVIGGGGIFADAGLGGGAGAGGAGHAASSLIVSPRRIGSTVLNTSATNRRRCLSRASPAARSGPGDPPDLSMVA